MITYIKTFSAVQIYLTLYNIMFVVLNLYFVVIYQFNVVNRNRFTRLALSP
jgi:hypothetical protein